MLDAALIYEWWPAIAWATYCLMVPGGFQSIERTADRLILVEGMYDVLAKSLPEETRERLELDYRVVKGGHFSPLECPTQVAEIVLESFKLQEVRV